MMEGTGHLLFVYSKDASFLAGTGVTWCSIQQKLGSCPGREEDAMT